MPDRLLFMLSKIQNTLTGHFKRELKQAGLDLSPGQMGILLALKRKSEMTMGQLSQVIESDNAAVTRLVDKLEKQGFVARWINLEDRRQMLVAITEDGLAKAGIISQISRTANGRIMEGFSEEEMAVYRRVNLAILEKFGR
jgi:DNA-binding MarR family transcriptional regulator